MNPLALFVALFAVLEVVLVTTLSLVQELSANAVMAAIVEATSALLSMTLIIVQVTAVRIELLTVGLPLVCIWLDARGQGNGCFLGTVTLCLALILLLKVVSVSVATSVVELTATCLRRVVVPTGGVVLAWSEVSGKFASTFN